MRRLISTRSEHAEWTVGLSVGLRFHFLPVSVWACPYRAQHASCRRIERRWSRSNRSNRLSEKKGWSLFPRVAVGNAIESVGMPSASAPVCGVNVSLLHADIYLSLVFGLFSGGIISFLFVFLRGRGQDARLVLAERWVGGSC